MSAVTINHGSHARATNSTYLPVPFSRLVQVELRKQVNTRSGRALLAVIAGLTALLLIPTVITGPADQVALQNLIEMAVTPVTLLLPVVAILAATSEWSQRTALVTFALEPRRRLVIFAKLVSAWMISVVFFVLAIGFAAVANLAAIIFRDTPGDWTVGWSALGQLFLALIIVVAQGIAFGILLQNSALAIVTYFVLPTVFMILINLVSFLGKYAAWYDLSTATTPLSQGIMVGGDWIKLLVASLIWVALPFMAGLVRVQRREVK